ncbi:TIGR01777 family oxidoreductase [Heliophilum fasciatum]|uniref:TIGR01777 family protein n=1 Tax=Heliophilum fasciatum TaxID=35700 RepID=A0A4R2RY20_9FIRM|nr:TIGR01777 family oxidoreductase [Heliophilum fasciatum]MCW2277066.1 uncharacterized protein (TIGR01777 family) [Heliophilum fasciatum]TCP68408.1 hypothetical protein EDD73_10337 [Heliophilum fasciatum]
MIFAVTGGTGFIGRSLVKRLEALGHEVRLVVRRDRSGSKTIVLPQNGGELDPASFADIDGVINLAGESIGQGRWTPERKAQLVASRVGVTGQLARALAKAQEQGARIPKVWINASGTGYYGVHRDKVFTEADGVGQGFLADLCLRWEAGARQNENLGLRVVILRFGVVLAPGGGALAQMAIPFKIGVGGSIGSGRQWMSWIHRDDLITMIERAISDEQMVGAYNACSPQPVTMEQMMNALGKAIGTPSWTRLPAFVARIALGEMADEMLLEGQRCVPERYLALGGQFRYPDVAEALRQIYR